MTDRVFEFHFSDGDVKVATGVDRIDAFQRLGLSAADANKVKATLDVTPRQRQRRLRGIITDIADIMASRADVLADLGVEWGEDITGRMCMIPRHHPAWSKPPRKTFIRRDV